ncbi:MAG: hypothetical protein FWE54_01720 [Methanimicrococcus sp.]|nr:hypothetical protein [Methanimicrococcus sp.]
MAYGKATIVPGHPASAANNQSSNTNQNTNQNKQNSGSESSSYNQVNQVNNPGGARIIDNPDYSDRDPARMSPAFARKLAARKNHPDFDGYVSNSIDSETYIDASGRQRVVPAGAKVDTTGWTLVDRATYANQRREDFGPNPARANQLDHAISSDPKVGAYMNEHGNLVIMPLRDIPKSANIVYNHDGTLSERSVERLREHIDPASQRIRADAQIYIYDGGILEQQYTESYERAVGQRISAHSEEDRETNKKFADHEKKMLAMEEKKLAMEKKIENFNRANLATQYVAAFSTGGPIGAAAVWTGHKISDKYGPKEIEVETIEKFNRASLATQYVAAFSTGGPIGVASVWTGHKIVDKYADDVIEAGQYIRSTGNELYQDIVAPADIDKRNEWLVDKGRYNSVAEINAEKQFWEDYRQSNIEQFDNFIPGYANFVNKTETMGKKISSRPDNFMVGLHDGFREDPVGIIAKTAAYTVLGAGIGAGAGLVVKGSKYLAPATNTFVRAVGVGSTLYVMQDANLYAQGLTYDLRKLSDITFADIRKDGILSNLESELVPGVRYEKFSDEYFYRLGEWSAQNLPHDIAGVISFEKTYRRVRPIPTPHDYINDAKRIIDKIIPKRSNVPIQLKPEAKTMNIIGRDINAPELRPGRRGQQDELFIGNRRGDELIIGDGFGNITRVYPGSNYFSLEIDPRLLKRLGEMADVFRSPTKIIRRYGNDNLYDYSNDYDYVNNYEYDYSSDPDFHNVVKNLTDSKNVQMYRKIEENVYGYREENAHNFRHNNMHAYGYATIFGFKQSEKYGRGFDGLRLPVPEFEWELNDQTNQKPLSPKQRKKMTKRDRNPFLDLANFRRII